MLEDGRRSGGRADERAQDLAAQPVFVYTKSARLKMERLNNLKNYSLICLFNPSRYESKTQRVSEPFERERVLRERPIFRFVNISSSQNDDHCSM